ncbi:MAG: nitroreductase family protein [Tumebacillaceae bacterium]
MAETTTTMTAEQVMRERHSVRYYQEGVKIPEAELNEMLELASTAPSAWNLQHWRFLVVTDQANKERLTPIAYGQQQVTTSSASVIILGDLEADKSGEEIYDGLVKAGQMPQEVRDNMVNSIKGAYQNKQYARDAAMSNATYAAMQLMLAAKAKGYDTVPMGGFDSAKLVEALNIPERYVPVVWITIGKAAKPAHASGRFPLDVTVIKESF